MSKSESQSTMSSTNHKPSRCGCPIVSIVLLLVCCGIGAFLIFAHMTKLPAVVVHSGKRWSQGLSKEVISYPLSWTLSDTNPAFAVDPSKVWTIVLARGSRPGVLDTVDVSHDGIVSS
jgi:hypothetical protein